MPKHFVLNTCWAQIQLPARTLLSDAAMSKQTRHHRRHRRSLTSLFRSVENARQRRDRWVVEARQPDGSWKHTWFSDGPKVFSTRCWALKEMRSLAEFIMGGEDLEIGGDHVIEVSDTDVPLRVSRMLNHHLF